jgi:hypothetical protein
LKPFLLMLIANTGRPCESIVGSGQFGTLRERMHRAKRRSSLSTCSTRAWGQLSAIMHFEIDPALMPWPELGSTGWQACWAARSWELLTPRWLASGLGRLPPLSGSE